MLQCFSQRLLTGLVTLILVSVIVFMLVRVHPGDADRGESAASEADLAAIGKNFGLDQPLLVQYAEWAKQAVAFDFGNSLRTGNLLTTDIGRRLPYTAQIILLAMLRAIVLSIPVGAICAQFVGNLIDRALQAVIPTTIHLNLHAPNRACRRIVSCLAPV